MAHGVQMTSEFGILLGTAPAVIARESKQLHGDSGRYKTHLDGFPSTVRIVRRRHAWEGQPLELMGWMRRRGRLELILILPDGSHLMVPAAWTDLQAAGEPIEAGTLGSLEDLLAMRRVLEPLLERVVDRAVCDWNWPRVRRLQWRCGS